MNETIEGARILVVDDEPLNLDVLEQELEDRGYEVELASDGPEALAQVVASPPDIILLDVIMPGLDGIEVCRRLKNDLDTAHIPIIIMTALNDVEDRIRGIEAGADDFLSKPVDDRELMARISTALKTKRAVDATRARLRDATERLAVLDSLDRDISVAIVADAKPAPSDLTGLAGESHVGVIDRGDASVAVVVLSSDPADHALVASRIAAHAAATGARAALESGTALVRSSSSERSGDLGWVESVEGPAYDRAAELLLLARPGQALMGEETARRTEGRIRTSELDGSPALVIEDASVGETPMESSPLELTWPADFEQVLEPLRTRWGVDGPIYLTRSLSGGRSGARVYAVDITCDEFSGQAILKLDRSRDPTWDENAEAERHKRAFAANQTFSTGHLPRIAAAYVDGNIAAVLSTIAGRGLEFVVPWAQCIHERQRASARVISKGILADWNADHQLSPPVSPTQLLTRWLGRKLKPETSRARPFLEAAGLEFATPTFFFGGQWYPNPFAFAHEHVPLPTRVALRAATGRLHGDFHGFNVLLRTDVNDPSDYYVIDLAYYDDDTYLLYDNAYMELGYLLHTRETTPPERWLRLVGASLGHGEPDGDDLGLVQLAEAIRAGVRDWIDEREPNRLGYMSSQSALARVAVGLNFANKRVSDHMRLLALLYASSNLKAYLRLHDIDWPTSGEALRLEAG